MINIKKISQKYFQESKHCINLKRKFLLLFYDIWIKYDFDNWKTRLYIAYNVRKNVSCVNKLLNLNNIFPEIFLAVFTGTYTDIYGQHAARWESCNKSSIHVYT